MLMSVTVSIPPKRNVNTAPNIAYIFLPALSEAYSTQRVAESLLGHVAAKIYLDSQEQTHSDFNTKEDWIDLPKFCKHLV